LLKFKQHKVVNTFGCQLRCLQSHGSVSECSSCMLQAVQILGGLSGRTAG
jgi:hypothetical protein